MITEVKRGYIFLANLDGGNVGSEQGGTRPVLVIQNDIGNKYSPTIIVACITSQRMKTKIPTHVEIFGHDHNLEHESIVLCEQIKTIDKSRLVSKIGLVSIETIRNVDYALRLSVGII